MANRPFDGLYGEWYWFYGVDDLNFKVGSQVYRAREDENDGYRSALDEVEAVEDTTGLLFFRQPLAKVKVVPFNNGYTDGDKLVGKDEHVWLTIGTENYHDYYPMFVFSYEPTPRRWPLTRHKNRTKGWTRCGTIVLDTTHESNKEIQCQPYPISCTRQAMQQAFMV